MKLSSARRLVATNPDGLGDLMIREPLYRSLLEAGRSLLLIVRPQNAWLARHLFPHADVLPIRFDPYAQEFLPRDSPDLVSLVAAILKWEPDALLTAPISWTGLEHSLSQALSGLARWSMTAAGEETCDAGAIRVDLKLPELEKNRVLAGHLLGYPPATRLPVLEASPAQLARADGLLESLASPRERLWVVTIGTDAATPLRALANWHAEGWEALLRHGITVQGLNFVLVGSTAEEPAHRKFVTSLGELATHARVVSDLPPDELVGLLHRAQGFMGRDTGTAHLAAAAGLPVLTAHGGGLGLRFVPSAKRGRTVVIPLPCAHCGWACPLSQSWCVKAIPIPVMKQAMDEILESPETGFRIIKLQPASLQSVLEEEGTAALKWLAFALTTRPAGDDCCRIHIGHHFYGAGNVGDDLMLAGFLTAVKRSGTRLKFTCCIPHDREAMRHRFPEIEWLPYTPEARMQAIGRRITGWGLGTLRSRQTAGRGSQIT